MAEEELLKAFVGVLEEHFPEAEVFRPRAVRLDQFAYLNDEEVDKYEEWLEDESIDLDEKVIDASSMRLDVDSSSVPVTAVDASSVQLGETNLGIISAVRVALWRQVPGERPSIVRYGPYMVHLTHDNVDFIYNYFRREIFGLKGRKRAPKLHKMTDRIRNFFERLAQRYACRIIDGGISLWDGSLTAGTVDTPRELMEETLSIAAEHENSVIAVSKQSVLRTRFGERILDLLEGEVGPCFKDIHDQISSRHASRILGRVHVVKFAPMGFSFRVDVAPRRGLSCCEALRLLRGNVSFYNGYPDPLRQVHISAYFTPYEVLSLQSLAVEKYHMRVIPSFDVRRHILGPFG